MKTDASLNDWGIAMGSYFPCGLTQMKKHINVLKLKTVLFGF